jgi:chromosome segregation ATPase
MVKLGIGGWPLCLFFFSLLSSFPFLPSFPFYDRNDYGRGSILRIRLVNVQKYVDCSVHPGPFMNMIMGPNGTGKSTLVAALALGLGYPPAVLGRSRDVAEYIRYGVGEAMIELVLKTEGVDEAEPPISGKRIKSTNVSDGGGYVKVKRIISRKKSRAANVSTASDSTATSVWLINDQPTTLAAVQSLAARLGVQADNLCQFLPQDRVSDFARLSPVEMLLATERAAGSAVMEQQHSELVALRGKMREAESDKAAATRQLELDRKQLEGLQIRAARAQEQAHRQERLRQLRRKRPYLEYEAAREEANRARAAVKAAKQTLDEAVKASAGSALGSQLKRLETEARRLRDAQEPSIREGVLLSRHVKEAREALDVATNAAMHARRTILRVRAKRVSKQAELERLRTELRSLEQGLRRQQEHADSLDPNTSANTNANTGPPGQNDQEAELRRTEVELDSLNAELESLKRASGRLQESSEAIMASLQVLDDTRTGKLARLQRFNPHACKAYAWLSEHARLFRRPVLGPLVLDIAVKDGQLAGVMESLISKSLQVAFLCQDAQDQELFMRKLCDEQSLQVNCLVMTEEQQAAALASFRAEQSLGPVELKRLGFTGYAVDYLDGPQPVLAALCEQAKIHRIPVRTGGSEGIGIEQCCQAVPHLVRFASLEHVFEVKRPRYNPADFAMRSSPPKAAFLLASSEERSKDRRQDLVLRRDQVRQQQTANQQRVRDLLTRQQRLQATKTALAAAVNEHMQGRRAWLKALADVKGQRAKIALTRDRLKALAAELSQNYGTEELQEAFKEELLGEADAFRAVAMACAALHGHCSGAFEGHIRLERAEAEAAVLRRRLESLDEETATRRAELAAAEQRRAAAQTRAESLLGVVEALDPGTDSVSWAAVYATLPEDLATLSAAILEEEARLETMGRVEAFSHAAVAELEAKMASVREREASLAALLQSRTRLQSDLDRLSAQWRPAVETMIGRISAAFASFFARIECQGEVRLHVPEHAEGAADFDLYALEVLVSFRTGEPLTRLSAHRQSGGEKSVATILYLLALQGLARAPFRVVDEINQGMDVNNERRVHSIIVDTSTGPGGIVVDAGTKHRDAAGDASTGHREAIGDASTGQGEGLQGHSQYFLITPKLLTGLSYHPRMHILCIYNGPGVPKPRKQERKPAMNANANVNANVNTDVKTKVA